MVGASSGGGGTARCGGAAATGGGGGLLRGPRLRRWQAGGGLGRSSSSQGIPAGGPRHGGELKCDVII